MFESAYLYNCSNMINIVSILDIGLQRCVIKIVLTGMSGQEKLLIVFGIQDQFLLWLMLIVLNPILVL